MGKKTGAKEFTLAELVTKLGMNERTVARLIERGELPVEVKGSSYIVDRDKLKELRAKLTRERAEMLSAFQNRDEIRYRALKELEEAESAYSSHPSTNRIQIVF